jgi:hypothetical protein
VRFNIAGHKFGHVPFTGLSPAEQALRAINQPVPGRQPMPAVGAGDAPGRAQPLAQRPPVRATALSGRQTTAPDGALPTPAPEPLQRNTVLGQQLAGPPPLADSFPAGVRSYYQKLNLAETPSTQLAFTSRDVTRGPAVLGAGRFNTVYSVQVRAPCGELLERVFKPLKASGEGWTGSKTGIPKGNPQVAMRNLATLEYAQKLGFDVVPDTKLALLQIPGKTPGFVSTRLGLLVALAPGREASGTDAATLKRPDVAREVTKLQLLDHLTGQGDRHGGNYFVHIDSSDRAVVSGIDNDQCFGGKARSPDAIRYARLPARKGFHGTELRRFLDTDMARAVNNIQHTDLQEMLGDKLTVGEIRAAGKRLDGPKRHISQLERRSNVVSPGAWEQRFTALADSHAHHG